MTTETSVQAYEIIAGHDATPDELAWAEAVVTVDGKDLTGIDQYGDTPEHLADVTLGDVRAAGAADLLDPVCADGDADDRMHAGYLREDVRRELLDAVAEQVCLMDNAIAVHEVTAEMEEYIEGGAVAYLVHSPRGFANEINCWAVRGGDVTAAEAMLDHIDWAAGWAKIETDADALRERIIANRQDAAAERRAGISHAASPAAGVLGISGWFDAEAQ